MYCTILGRHFFCRSSGIRRLYISRSLGSYSLRPRLVKSEEAKVYRLQSGRLGALLGLEKIHRQTGFLSERSSALKYQIYLACKSIFVENQTVRMPPVPPETTRRMTILDRDAFRKVIDVPTLRVPVEHVGQFQKKVNKYLFKMRGVKPVAELSPDRPDGNKFRLFLFDPDKFKSKEKLYEIAKVDIDTFNIDLKTWDVVEIELNYSNWPYDEILRAILPEETDGISGFSVIGHVLHLNLKDELLPYKKIIGEVLLDKVSTAETVVNKTNTIDNTFRNFAMEVLAGKDDFITTAKENGLAFKMDFSRVYWNPRLSTEHQRIVNKLKPGYVLYDIFAGIGPFAVPAAKKKCIVLANDLNPESHKWLQANMTENKVKSNPQLYNLDGRDFIKTIVKTDIMKRWTDEDCNHNSMHVVMNLPALAVEFLDAFVGLLGEMDPTQFPHIVWPQVHCYTFSKADDPVADVRERVEASLGSVLPSNHTIRTVRNVAPNKDMLCAEFELGREVLFARSSDQACGSSAETEEPPTKKNRIEA